MKPSLTKLSTSQGQIKAVHSWATGYQVLVFDSIESFDKAKKAVDDPKISG